VTAACRLAPITQNADQNFSREQLISEHIDLVKTIALSIQRSIPAHVELDDLIHSGMAGLFDAALKYSEEKETSFRTYAQYRIRGAILDGLRRVDSASRDLRKRFKKVQAATQSLSNRLGRTPAESELAAALGIDCSELRAWNLEFRALPQQTARTRDEQEAPAAEIAAAPAQHPDQIFARHQLQLKLKLAMLSLPVRHREVVELYYEGERTMREIGEIMGVNESRISQIHKAALSRMQKTLSASGVTSCSAFC
jgi:RNA polymerase sigma factor for flagellar operon FliA